MARRLPPRTEIALLAALPVVVGVCLALIGWGDRPAALWAHGFEPGWRSLFSAITQLGNSVYYLVPFGFFGLGCHLAARREVGTPRGERLRRWAQIWLFLFLAVAASGLASGLLKFIFGRARPTLLFGGDIYGFHWFHGLGKWTSFPSGHSNTVFALATALWFLVPRAWAFTFSAAALVAFSRVAVGAHYPSDVLAGAFLAVAVTLYVRQLFQHYGVRIFAGER